MTCEVYLCTDFHKGDLQSDTHVPNLLCEGLATDSITSLRLRVLTTLALDLPGRPGDAFESHLLRSSFVVQPAETSGIRPALHAPHTLCPSSP